MLRAIMRVLPRVLAAVGRGLIKLGALFGRRAAPAMPSPEFEELVDEQSEELRQELDAVPEAAPAPVTSLGARIHAYAGGSADGRARFDFDGVPDDVALTLVSLTEVQLGRLAAAGPVACARWALGEKTGLVGVPAPAMPPPTAPGVDEAPDEPEGPGPAPAPSAAAA